MLFDFKSRLVSSFAALAIPAAAVTLPNWNFVTFNVSSPTTLPQRALGIDGSGRIVGQRTKQVGGTQQKIGFRRDLVGALLDLADPDTVDGVYYTGTYSTAISSDGNNIVGIYAAGDQYLHSYLYAAGVFQKIDLPGINDGVGNFLDVIAYGVNNNMTVVGFAATTPNARWGNGYVQTSVGHYTTFSCFNSGFTQLLAINDQGIMLGTWQDSDEVDHPFWTNGVGGACNALPEVSGGMRTVWNGINNHNQIIGSTWDPLTYVSHGLYGDLSNGTFVQFDVPGYVGKGSATALNDSVEITGAVTTSTGGTLLFKGTPMTLAFTNVSGFPNTKIGQQAAKTFTCKNVGHGIAKFGSFSITEAGGKIDYKVTSTNCPSTINVGSSCTVTVAFAPVMTGWRNANLLALSPDKKAMATMTLNGQGVK
jgi:hypothetical protein